MATTTYGNTPTTTTTNRTSLYWGIAIAIVLALAVILTVQTTSTRDTVVTPRTSTSDTVNTPVERSTVPPMEVAPRNSDVNQPSNPVDTVPPTSSP